MFSGVAAAANPIGSPKLAQEIRTGEPASVNVDSLTVRQGPGLDAGVVVYLSYGTDVEVLDGPVAADGYDWFLLAQGGATIGWAVQGFAQPAVPLNAAPAGGTGGANGDIQIGATVTVNVPSLVVRGSPSLSGADAGSLTQGTDAVVVDGPVVADGYDWFQLEQGGTVIGWSVQGFVQTAAPATGGTIRPIRTAEIPAAETTWTVTDGFLPIRANPSDAGSIARVVTNGTELTQSGDSVDLDGVTWFPVDDNGWIDGQDAGLTLERYPLFVSADVLNVRSDPSLSATIVQTLSRGDTVNTFGSTRDADGVAWSAVNEDNTLWVAAEYLTIRL